MHERNWVIPTTAARRSLRMLISSRGAAAAACMLLWLPAHTVTPAPRDHSHADKNDDVITLARRFNRDARAALSNDVQEQKSPINHF